MPARLRHFALNAGDVQKAKRFYEAVFDWEFTPWGPPNFYQIFNAGEGMIGALQERRELIPGKAIFGFENSFAVDDLAATLQAAVDAGGRILMAPYLIEGVGEIAYFEDPDGNAVGVAQYLPGRWD